MRDVVDDAGSTIWRLMCGVIVRSSPPQEAVPDNPADSDAPSGQTTTEAKLMKWASMKGRDTW